VNRGDIFRYNERLPEQGLKAGFYVIVSRQFIVQHVKIATVIAAPIYSEILGLATEVAVGPECGIPHASSIRCDFLTLLLTSTLNPRVGVLPSATLETLDRALAKALDLRFYHPWHPW
jgi:mRNA-degrading endonuclease toxin of MazEF toxin-antitoxin module